MIGGSAVTACTGSGFDVDILAVAPGSWAVTVLAGMRIVVCWSIVAGSTVGLGEVDVDDLFPIFRAVAVGALPAVVWLGPVLCMAGLAVIEEGMHSIDDIPALEGGMAVGAQLLTGIVALRGMHRVARLALGDFVVVVFVYSPVIHIGMAQVTLSRIMRTVLGFVRDIECVTGQAFSC
jgi:hypothetical protein